ncbi:hypothetical protein TNCV_344621 [Trichonephila clavipes]|nr:hypothetical protein TNCV_344621 [Trichonephila clavipes]
MISFHIPIGEPVKVNFIPMPDLPESSSDSDNEYSKLQGYALGVKEVVWVIRLQDCLRFRLEWCYNLMLAGIGEPDHTECQKGNDGSKVMYNARTEGSHQ